MSLQVRFTFSDELMKKNDMKREDVYYTLKKRFKERGLVCVSDDDVLMFEGTGHKDDYGHIWGIIIALIDGDWFEKCASSCDYIEDGEVEDVFSQIPKLKKMREEIDRMVINEDYEPIAEEGKKGIWDRVIYSAKKNIIPFVIVIALCIILTDVILIRKRLNIDDDKGSKSSMDSTKDE